MSNRSSPEKMMAEDKFVAQAKQQIADAGLEVDPKVLDLVIEISMSVISAEYSKLIKDMVDGIEGVRQEL